MDRRDFLSSLGVGLVGATSGCVAGGRPVVDESTSVTVEAADGWWKELPDVGGDGALSFSVRADQMFDVYYFTSEEAFGQYKRYIFKEAPTASGAETAAAGTATPTVSRQTPNMAMPSGHDEISQASIPKGSKYAVEVPGDGGRKDVETTGSHYLVVDHSNYDGGVRVDPYEEPLDAFVDLMVYDGQSFL